MKLLTAASLALVLALALAATACRSASTTYYTLVAPVSEPANILAPAPDYQLDVLPVEVPAQVDRAEIVVRQGAGQLTPVDSRSWIAPLPAELQRALSNELTLRLGARDVDGLVADAATPTLRVKLSVQRFESELGKLAELDALWTVRDAATAPGLLCRAQIREPATKGYNGLAEAHQRAIGRLAAQIATGIRDLRAHGTATCPAL